MGQQGDPADCSDHGVTTLSLNARDREALSLIEEALSATDPRLAAKLSAFARLADGEAMPERERIAAGRWCAIGRRLRDLCPGLGLPGRMSWIPVAVWLCVSVVLFSVALVLSHANPHAVCAQWQGVVCVDRAATPVPPAPSDHQGHPVPLVP